MKIVSFDAGPNQVKDLNAGTIQALVAQQPGLSPGSRRPVRSDPWQPGPGRLTLVDREEISLGLREGASFTALASRLAKAVSTISRDVGHKGGRAGYRAWRADQQARERARPPKTPKLAVPGSSPRSRRG